MGLAAIDFRYETVHKVYPPGHPGWACEIAAYEAVPWAAPRLMWYGEGWLETERCVPLLSLEYDQTLKYRDPLRELLVNLHEAGWWHCDAALVNVVIHPSRGVLLVDWENAQRATSDLSYDLYGARLAGEVDKEMPASHRPDGVWWSGPWKESPAIYWGEV